MKLPLFLASLLAVVAGCAGEDLSVTDGGGAQGGAGSGQAGQGPGGAGGQAGGGPGGAGVSGGSGQSGAAGGAGAGQAGEAGQTGVSGQGGAGAGQSGAAGQGGAAAQGGASGQAGAAGVAGQSGAGPAGAGGVAGQTACLCPAQDACHKCDVSTLCKSQALEGHSCVQLDGMPGVCSDLGVCQPDFTKMGCADGTREGMKDTKAYPDTAACQGAWQMQGIKSDAPTCDRRGGNTGTSILDGQSCSAADQCAEGWHVCRSGKELFAKGGSNPCPATVPGAGENSTPTFYASKQSDTSTDDCSLDVGKTDNDIYGCGVNGPFNKCNPFNERIGTQKPMAGWAFPLVGGKASDNMEKLAVIKAQGPGGVLCCRN